MKRPVDPSKNSPGARETVAVLRGVTKTFDSFLTRALAEATFNIRRGEVFGLFGPERSGKSTTLKLLAGRVRPTEGRIRVFGRAPWRAASRRRIGFAPGKSAREKASEQSWFDLLAGWFSRAARVTDRHWDLKQAVLGGRDFIVLDEPFLGLDSAAARELRELILTLAQQGKTVVFSSRSLAVARGLCDRIAIFGEGKIRAIGTLDELLAAPVLLGHLTPVLAETLNDRLLRVVRDELLQKESGGAGDIHGVNIPPAAEDQALASLTKPASPHPEPAPLPKADTVDHQKLEELTRPPEDRKV